MTSLLKSHKNIAKQQEKEKLKKLEELQKLNKEMADKFVNFQLDNNARANIVNPYSQDIIVQMVMSHASIAWRPMEEEEKRVIQAEMAKKSGIELPK